MKKDNLKLGSFADIKRVFVSNIPLFLIIAGLAVLVFFNGMRGEFVSDDIPGIVNNSVVQNLGIAISKISLQHTLWALVYAMFGLNELPFHLLSLAFHIINVFLFFIIIYNLFDKKIAGITSVLYAVHPLTSETILWISAFNYLLNTFFLYISVVLYLLYVKSGEKKYLISILVIFTTLIFTFPNFWILTIPFFIAGLHFFLLQKDYNLKFLVKLIPLFLLGILAFYYFGHYRSGIQVGERISSLATPEATPYFNRLPYSFYMTGELLIYPKNLTLYHEGEILSKVKLHSMTVLTILFFIALFILWRKPKNRTVVGLIALIFISILPVFSPLQVAWFAAERYLYVAVGLFSTLIAMWFIHLDKKNAGKSLAVILTFVLATVYSIRTFARTYDWKTRKSLWLATEKVSPFSHRAHNNLGDVYGVEGDWEKSIAHFKRAIEIKPTYSEAIHNLGNTYMLLGELETAKKLFLLSIEQNPNLYQSLHKLGLVEYNLGNTEVAKQYFEQSLRVNPEYAPAIQALQVLQQKSQ